MKHRSQKLIFILVLFFFSPGCAFFTPPPPLRPPPDPANLYAYALNLYRANRFAEAVGILKNLKETYLQDPQAEAADPILGLALLEMGKYTKSLPHLQLALQSYPNLTDLFLLHLAQAQKQAGQMEAAAKNLRGFAALFPSSPYLEQALYAQVEAEEKMKNIDSAYELAARLLQRFPSSPNRDRYLFLHAWVARKYGDLPAAVHSLRELWTQFPLSPLLPQAEALLSRIPSASWPPTPEERYRQGLLLYVSGAFDPAEKVFGQLVSELEPSGNSRLLVSSQFRLGMIKFKKRQYSDARDRLQYLLQVNDLPPELAEEALLYLGRSYTRNREPEAAEKVYRTLMGKYPGGMVTDEALYLLGRLQEDQGLGNEAQKTYQEVLAKFPQSQFGVEVHWRLGWSAYLQKNYADAVEYFSRIPETGIDLISDLKPRFWKARALSQSGQPERGNLILQELSEQFPLTYYGFISSLILRKENSLGLAQILALRPAGRPGPDFSASSAGGPGPDQLDPEDDFFLQRASDLIELGLYPEANLELHFLINRLSRLSPATLLLVGQDLVRIGNLSWLLSLCESYFPGELKDQPGSRNWIVWELAYPRGFRQLSDYFSRQYGLDPNLVRAVIREESRFFPQALSPVGAIGLMQIMPKTGRDIARNLGRTDFSPAALNNPEINMEFGYYYLTKLVEQFQGNLAYALGAYNAGPNKLRDWLSAKPGLDLFEFIEDIPYPETNGYVKKVLQNYLRYSYLYPDNRNILEGSNPGQIQ